MKLYILIGIIGLVLLLVFFKVNDYNKELPYSNMDKTVFELTSDIYTDNQLNEIVHFKGNLEMYNKKYNIDCIRNLGTFYRVSYLGNNNRVAVIVFDNKGNKQFANLYNVNKFSAEYDSLTVGLSLEDIMAFDEMGDYSFLYTGRLSSTNTSQHYTKDGYLIYIEYNQDNKVSHIYKELV